MDVVRFGFWDEWQVRNNNIKHLYGRAGETSKRVIEDVRNGTVFSKRAFSMKVWDDLYRQRNIPPVILSLANEANQGLKQLYKRKGLTLRTLDDAK